TVFTHADAPFQLRVGSGKFPARKQGKPQSFVGKNLVIRLVYVLGCIQQMFGKRLSFTKRRTHEIPGPQTEHRSQGMFVKPTLFAQLVCSHVRMLPTLNTPAFSRSEGVAERSLQQQLQLVA